MAQRLEFWFDFSCPFAYVASTQVEQLAQRTGAELDLRPMLLGGVFKARGTPQNLAATLSPAKARHNLDDMRRQAQRAGVPLRMPPNHPMRTVAALRCVLAAGLHLPLVHRIYRAYWDENADIGDREVLARALAEVGLDAAAILARAESPAIKDELRRRTDEAIARGVFGVPTYFVGDQLFWGQDRADMVEEALGGAPVGLVASPTAPVEFFFDYSSPFAYLAIMRAAELGPQVRWRPILLGGLFRNLGTPDVPLFVQSPEKRRHTMQDLDRQAARAGLPFKFPARFPVRTVLPLRVTLAAGSPPPLVRALATALWAEDRDISDPATVAAIADSLALDGAALVAAAETPEIKQALATSTAEAEAAGVFGVPTFVVHTRERGPQLYWGADRLTLAAAAAGGDVSAM
ncbi:2-hydroxychromene-2-carboxylate isomerase [Nannocystis exedens]|uniref:2-hydroxychromene-2-carboxylate isomerase n=1 Tax=Nannocystis exedens TaxID=54 RepID=A0A1I1VPQ5_9BACT|nr:2-hydroxychromene-2-carboxylate isomerase [Nannocystis exedens]PCC72585.1 DSBA oxidoreductase [Nannocystis exedens]SFD83013.1 2-hydroxychromene-2-carboxylate isomerase [Nannocystis exedens]